MVARRRDDGQVGGPLGAHGQRDGGSAPHAVPRGAVQCVRDVSRKGFCHRANLRAVLVPMASCGFRIVRSSARTSPTYTRSTTATRLARPASSCACGSCLFVESSFATTHMPCVSRSDAVFVRLESAASNRSRLLSSECCQVSWRAFLPVRDA